MPATPSAAHTRPLLEVAVPSAAFARPLTYQAPADQPEVLPGVRVRVRVGGQRLVGVVVGPAKPYEGKLRPVEAVLDDSPVLLPDQLQLAAFIAQYYLAPIGEVLRLMLPPETRRQVRFTLRLTERGAGALVLPEAHQLTPRETRWLARLSSAAFTPPPSGKWRPSMDRLERWQKEGLLERQDEAGKKQVRMVRTVHARDGGDPVPARAHALGALDAWLRTLPGPVPTKEVGQVFPGASAKLKRLAALGRVAFDERPRALGVHNVLAADARPAVLTDGQAMAVGAILAKPGGAFLLEGVTGSGKTEVYLRVLEHMLAHDKGAILVVPEIALTPQLLARVSRVAGDAVVVQHSGLTPADRRDGHAALLAGRARVVVGARSALLSPVQNLGLIVVDEEHEGSLKQDETPRYHGRDVALWRARHTDATIVLGSATPSLESRHNAMSGKLEHLMLDKRVGARPLPTVEVVDLKDRKHPRLRKKDGAQSEGTPLTILSGPLQDAIQETLDAGHQAMLFLNRRGYATTLLCDACGEVVQCPTCSVSLTYHRARGRAVCHQCDHSQPRPDVCPSCHAESLVQLGLGTERIQAEVDLAFEGVRTARLDRDIARRHEDVQATLKRFQDREIDVLVGTQMIAKGHDFPGVALVGVVLADTGLSMPDFRAAERSFQLLTQVAGRAGRGDIPGRVLIQTYNPDHPAVRFAAAHDVQSFAAQEMRTRETLSQPPFARAALVRLDGENATSVATIANRVGQLLRTHARARLKPGWTVLGPAPAPLERLRGKTRMQVFARAPTAKMRRQLLSVLWTDPQLEPALRKARVRLVIDVDPQSML